jgi:hypothetical protein
MGVDSPTLRQATSTWAAAGFKDTLFRWNAKPELVHGSMTS